MAKKAAKKTKTLKVDFGGVEKEIRKRSKDIPETDYIFKVTKGEVKKNKNGDGRHLLFSLQVVEDAKGGKKYAGVPKWYRCSLKPDALFNLRNFIFAASDGKKNVAGKKSVDVDPAAFVGKKVAGSVENEEHDGKTYNSVVAVFPPSELVEEEDEDETEDDDEEDDDDEEEEDEDEDDDDDEEEDDLDDVDDDDL